MLMILFCISLQPFLQYCANKLNGIEIDGKNFKIMAYADDVTVYLSSPDEIQVIQQALIIYGRSSGAKFNYRKPGMLPLGSWPLDNTENPFPIKPSIKVFGLHS